MARVTVSNRIMFSEPQHRTVKKEATFLKVDSRDSMKSGKNRRLGARENWEE